MEGKRLGKKIPPGVEAITNRLGASTVVINTLQRPVAEEHLFFLKDVAEQARAILETIKKIEEGHVDEDFAFLALDTCGLIYVIINECDKFVNRGEIVPEKFKWETGELEGFLKKIQAFMDKKIARGVFKRIYKQSKDHDKVDTYRERLQNSMPKFGVFDQKSIQDILERIISEKVLQHDIQARHAQGLGRNDSISSVTVQLAQHMVAMASLEKPLPVVIVEDAESDREDSAAVLNRLDVEREERMRKQEELRILKAEDEARRKLRLAQAQQAKKAEKERWRRSEQEFHRLPDATGMLSPAHKLLSRPTSPEETAPSIVISDSESDSEDDVTSIPARSSTPLKDQLRDQQIARQLQEQFDREVESEKRMKERQALKLALKLQRELDEEDEDEDLSDSEESDFEEPPPPPGRREEPSPSRPPGRPRSLPTPAQNYSSPIPPMAGPPFGVFPQGPPYPGFHPGYIPHAVHPSTSFSSLQGSAVSMGGGPVTLINSNSGNTQSFNIRDSFNDNSVRMGRDSDSD